MYYMSASREEILGFAKPVLAASLRRQRRACLPPQWRPQARVTIKQEMVERPTGEMLGFPHEAGISMYLSLGEDWYEVAGRTGVLEVGGYFICRYDTFDDQGRPREVRAVRLVPTCGGEDWQYIPSPATICWDGEHSMIRWHVPDDEAAWRAYGRE